MSNKQKGIEQKYVVFKADGSSAQPIQDECIVLKFKDPIAREGLNAWARAMRDEGYDAVAQEVFAKCKHYEELDRARVST